MAGIYKYGLTLVFGLELKYLVLWQFFATNMCCAFPRPDVFGEKHFDFNPNLNVSPIYAHSQKCTHVPLDKSVPKSESQKNNIT